MKLLLSKVQYIDTILQPISWAHFTLST